MNSPSKLSLSLAFPILAGGLGTLFTTDAIRTWYPTLVKPFFSPPNWLFGPVWTLLYILMGIACYQVWTAQKEHKQALVIFAIQLALNAIWSPLFFGLHSPLLGLINISLLWIMIVWTMIAFGRIKKSAAYLLIPYIAWVSFATILNTTIVALN